MSRKNEAAGQSRDLHEVQELLGMPAGAPQQLLTLPEVCRILRVSPKTLQRRIEAGELGRWFGEYGVAFCPAHKNTRTPALSLRDGDYGRLLAYCHAGCDYFRVAAGLRALGLITGTSSVTPMDPARDGERRLAEKAERERQIRRARACWFETVRVRGTLVERYLRRRHIRCVDAFAQTWRAA